MDFSSSQPIYLQIADEVRRKILVGDLTPGDQLMSTTRYATTYRINPATANKAFALLVDEGVIEKRRGIGMFVTQTAPETLRANGRTTYLDETLSPALDEGLTLGFSSRDLLDLTEEHLANADAEDSASTGVSAGQPASHRHSKEKR